MEIKKCKCGQEARIFLEGAQMCFDCFHAYEEKRKDATYCSHCGRGIETEVYNKK
jgi:hypothetical protein